MKPPDILLADSINGNGQPMDTADSPGNLLQTAIDDINVNDSNRQTLPTDDTEIPHPPAPNNEYIYAANCRSLAANSLNINVSQQKHNINNNCKQQVPQKIQNFQTNRMPPDEGNPAMLTSGQNKILTLNTNQQTDNIINNCNNSRSSLLGNENAKTRKVSFSSLDGDILPIPLQSLLLELSDQDFEMSVPLSDEPFDKDSLLSTTIDDWANQMT